MDKEMTVKDAALRLEQMKNGKIPPKEVPTLANPMYAKAYDGFLKLGATCNTLREGSDGEGGYLVPDEFEHRVVQAMSEKNVMRRLGTVMQTERTMKYPVGKGIGYADWIPEEGVIPITTGEFDEVKIEAHKVATSIRVSDELLEDSTFDLEGFIIDRFAQRIGDAEEEAFIRGDGNGKPLGLIYQAPVGAVSEDTGDISLDDMLELEYSVESAYRKKAVWVMSDDAYNRLRKINHYQGRPVWRNGLEKGDPKHLFGHPVYVCKAMDDVAPDSIPVMFGDFSCLWIGDRGKRVIKRLVERYADRGQVAFITSERVDAKLVLSEAVKMLKVKSA